jgi:cytosine/uracil/thiamine/allantoin permease
VERQVKHSPLLTLDTLTRGVLDYFAVFPWPAFCISSWTGGSMLLALGLTVPQAIGAAVSSPILEEPVLFRIVLIQH